jgi:hypothetical protein
MPRVKYQVILIIRNITHPLPLPMLTIPYIASNIELASIVCRNKCMRLSSKIIVDQSHYSDGKKYYRRCTHYYITEKVFCECCGMQRRTTPMISTYKRILRKKLGTIIRLPLLEGESCIPLCTCPSAAMATANIRSNSIVYLFLL